MFFRKQHVEKSVDYVNKWGDFMNITQLRDEQALCAAGEMLDAAEEILADEQVRSAVRGGISRIRCASLILKTHPGAVMRILAAAEGVPAGEYHCTAAGAVRTLAELLAEETVRDFFPAAPRTPTSCGCACGPETDAACAT